MAVCDLTTRRAVLTALGTAAICAAPLAVQALTSDPFIPLASEFLELFGHPDYDLDGACSQGWCSRLTELETGMAAHPPRSMAGLLLGLKVIRANDMVEWSDLETGIIDAGIRILGKEE